MSSTREYGARRASAGAGLSASAQVLVVLATMPLAAQTRLLPALQGKGEIIRDSNGMPHIYAENEHDVFFLAGWVQAEDRLFQIDVARRKASGTVAELLGSRELASDVELRIIGTRRAAERSLPLLSDAVRSALEAYSAGVNAYVESHPLPPEYAALELTRFEPWTPLDSVAVAKHGLGSFFYSLDIGATDRLSEYERSGRGRGFDGTALYFEDIYRAAPFDPASTVPDATGAVKRDGAGGATLASPVTERLRAAVARLRPETLALARSYLERVRDIPFFREGIEIRDRISGSNQWAVSGAHTVSGFPLLANDPHMALDTPPQFYQMHLVAGDLDVTGSCFPGFPFVVLGHNRSITWGATVNPVDITDTYEERIVGDETSPSGLSTVHAGTLEHVVALPVEFRYNRTGDRRVDNVTTAPPSPSVPAEVLIVPRRSQGPLVEVSTTSGVGLSVQFTGFSGTRDLEAFYRLNHAEDLDDFAAALKFMDTGSFNWAYADVEGNIAYLTSGEIPLREDLESGAVEGLPPFFVRDGSGGNEWIPVADPPEGQSLPYAILPQGELPHAMNPPAGYFVNANNDPAGTSLDNDSLNQYRATGGIYYLERYYAEGFRAGRITQMLRERLSRGKVSLDDMKAIQADTVLLDAQFFVPWVIRAAENARLEGTHPDLVELAGDPAMAEAVGRFAAWDFSTPTGIDEGYDAADEDGVLSPPSAEEIAASVAATIYAVWRRKIMENTIDVTLRGRGVHSPGSGQTLIALRHLFERFAEDRGVGASGLDFFRVSGVDDADARRDILVLRSLSQALRDLAGPAYSLAFRRSANQDDYRWGRLHRLVLDHPLGGEYNTPTAFGVVPTPIAGLPGIPADGGIGTVDVAWHNGRASGSQEYLFGDGPSHRFVAEASPERIHAETSLPGGESAVPGSPFYQNLLASWLTNETHRLLASREDILADASTVRLFAPAPRFLRGDCTGDGAVDISDSLCILTWLFGPREAPDCLAEANANSDSATNIADATYLLYYLFSGAAAPSPPFPECGTSELDGDAELGCAESCSAP